MKTSERIRKLTHLARDLTGFDGEVTCSHDGVYGTFKAQFVVRRERDDVTKSVTYETFKVLDIDDGSGETYSKAVKDLYENVQILLADSHHFMGEAGIDEDACAC